MGAARRGLMRNRVFSLRSRNEHLSRRRQSSIDFAKTFRPAYARSLQRSIGGRETPNAGTPAQIRRYVACRSHKRGCPPPIIMNIVSFLMRQTMRFAHKKIPKCSVFSFISFQQPAQRLRFPPLRELRSRRNGQSQDCDKSRFYGIICMFYGCG